MIFDDIHFNVHEVRTHNCDINLLLSTRETGKSTAVLKMALDEYEKNGWRSIWLLRQKSQLNKQFFDTLLNDFEDRKFIMERKVVYVMNDDGTPDLNQPVITFGAVSTGNKDFKQTKLKNIRFMIYDEFLIDHQLPNERYLEDEAKILFKIWDTIQRRSERKTQLWLLANPYSFINPYFNWFKLDGREVEKRVNKIYKPFGNNRLLVYYFTAHPDLIEQKEATTYGFFSKMQDSYYQHTFKGKQQYKPMFPIRPFNKFNDKKYLLKIKIASTVLEFWQIEAGGLYVAAKEYKKDKPIAVDFDSFHDNASYNNPNHPYYNVIKDLKYMIAARSDVVLESTNIEFAVKLFVKQT